MWLGATGRDALCPSPACAEYTSQDQPARCSLPALVVPWDGEDRGPELLWAEPHPAHHHPKDRGRGEGEGPRLWGWREVCGCRQGSGCCKALRLPPEEVWSPGPCTLSQAPGTCSYSPLWCPCPSPFTWSGGNNRRTPRPGLQDWGSFSYLSAKQPAEAGGAGCAPRGQGMEGVAIPGWGEHGRRGDLERGAGLHGRGVCGGRWAWGRKAGALSGHYPT